MTPRDIFFCNLISLGQFPLGLGWMILSCNLQVNNQAFGTKIPRRWFANLKILILLILGLFNVYNKTYQEILRYRQTYQGPMDEVDAMLWGKFSQ